MESKQQLLEMLSKAEHDRRKYFCNLFKYVPEAIAAEMSYAEVRKGDCILSEGAPSDTVYIILSGRVIGLSHQRKGRVYSFMDFTKMYIVGDFEVFGGFSEYGISICAAKDCRLLKISSKKYLCWIKHDENALFLRLNNIMTVLTFERRLDREYVFMGCKERLADFLVKFYEKETGDSLKKVKVDETQAELADKVGFNVRSVQRNIAALEKKGFVSNENGKITISEEQYRKLKQYRNEEEKE